MELIISQACYAENPGTAGMTIHFEYPRSSYAREIAKKVRVNVLSRLPAGFFGLALHVAMHTIVVLETDASEVLFHWNAETTPPLGPPSCFWPARQFLYPQEPNL
jgi:hypothetical protein